MKPKHVVFCYAIINDENVLLRNIRDTFLWECIYSTDNVRQSEEHSFAVRVKYNAYWDFMTYDFTSNPKLVLSSSQYLFIRLYVNKTKEENALSEMIVDLINRVACKDIQDCLLQMETLTKKIDVTNGDNIQVLCLANIRVNADSNIVTDVRDQTQSNLSANNIIAYCYFLCVVGKGFQIEQHGAISRFFSRETVALLLRSFANCKKENYPTTCIRTISYILPHLFKFCYQDKSSVLLLVSFTFKMMDESILLSMIDHSQKENLFPFYEETSCDFLLLLMVLYKKALADGQFALLENVIKHLPGQNHRQFLEHIIQMKEEWHDALEKSISILQVKDNTAFRTLGRTHDLQGVLNLLRRVDSSLLKNTSNEVIQLAEKAIISCLEKVDTFTGIQDLLLVVNDKRFFNDETLCLKVIELFATSNCVEIQSHLSSLLNNENVISLDEIKTHNLLEDWFVRKLQCTKQNFEKKIKPSSDKENERQQHTMIVEVYHIFADAISTDYIRKYISIKRTFEETIFVFLQSCSFKALISVVQQNIENSGDLQEIQETISMHIRQLLTNGHVGENPNVIMQDICGKDKLLVNSR